MKFRFKSVPFKVPGSKKRLYDFDKVKEHQIKLTFDKLFCKLLILNIVASFLGTFLLYKLVCILITQMFNANCGFDLYIVFFCFFPCLFLSSTLAKYIYIKRKLEDELKQIYLKDETFEVVAVSNWLDFLKSINQR